MTPFSVNFGGIKPVAFGAPPPAQDAPATDAADDAKGDAARGKPGQTFLARVQQRRMAGIKRAAEILEVLPGPGESLHALMLGYFDLLNVVLALLDRLDIPCLHLRIATLCFSVRNVSELAALLDTKQAAKIDLLTSDFQRKHDGAILGAAMQELAALRGQRVAAARSHCKIVLLSLADARQYVIEGSANLRTSRNQEQFCLSQDGPLHEFYARWFDSMMDAHEIRAGESTPQKVNSGRQQ